MRLHHLAVTFGLLAIGNLPCQAMSKKNSPASQPPSSAASTADADKVWVGKSDEAKSCAKERGIPLDNMAAALAEKEIKVFSKKKVSDGKMRIQMCGADKGDMNGYLILKKDLEKAKEIGFQLVNAPH